MTEIRTTIPAYAGHEDAPARRLSDQQIRAWVGERLAALRERLPAAAAIPAFDDILVHCQFGDQHVIKALEDDRFADPGMAAKVEAEDENLLEAVAPSDTVDAAGAPAFLAALQQAFTHRNTAIVALGPPSHR